MIETLIFFFLLQENSETFDVIFGRSILYNIALKEFKHAWIFIMNNKGC